MRTTSLSWIALLLAVGAIVACHLHWSSQLPHRVATHFNAAGHANGWMSQQDHFWGSLAVHLGTSAFIVLLCALMHRLPPSLMNLPRKDYWSQPENYPLACAFMRGWSRWLATVILVWGLFMDRQIFIANQTHPPRLDSAAIGMLTGCFLSVVLAFILWLVLKFLHIPATKPDEGRATK